MGNLTALRARARIASAPTMSQLAVLGAIAKYPKGTRVTAKLIGYELDIPESAAQQRLVRMQKVGLVRRGGWEVAK